jgi:hypothetical protein
MSGRTAAIVSIVSQTVGDCFWVSLAIRVVKPVRPQTAIARLDLGCYWARHLERSVEVLRKPKCAASGASLETTFLRPSMLRGIVVLKRVYCGGVRAERVGVA